MKGAHGLGSLTEPRERQGQRTAFSTLLPYWRSTFAAALLVAIVYAISLSIMPKHVFWMPDEGAKLFELRSCSLSWKDGVVYRLPFAAQRLMPGKEFLPGFDVYPEPKTMSDGSLYLEFDTPVIFPLLTAPFFHAFGPAGLYIIPVVCGWLVALVSGVLASWFAPVLAPYAVLLVGLATPVWFYSVVFWEHTLATLVTLIAVCLLIRAPRRIESIAATVPLLLVATGLRTEVALFGIAFVVAWVIVFLNGPADDTERTPTFLPRGRVGRLATALAVIALGVLVNSVLTSRHKSMVRVLPDLIEQAFSGITHLPKAMFEVFINSQHLGPHMSTAWKVAAVFAVLAGLATPLIRSDHVRSRTVIVALSIMFACSASLVFTGEPFRGLHGLFPVAPLAILWPLGLRDAWRRHDAPLLALGTATGVYMLLVLAALGLTYIHRGKLDVGMQWGQRYQLTAYPMLIVLSLVGVRALLASLRPGVLRITAVTGLALAFAGGVGLEVRGMRMLHGTRTLMAKWDEAMRSEGPIVTTVWWIVPAVADLFLDHEMFFMWNPAVAHWVDLARQRGITSFTLAHTEPLTNEQLGGPAIRRLPEESREIAGGLLLTRYQIDPVPAP